MKIFRESTEAQFIFNLASQQKCKVSTLLGMRPHDDAMSNNELLWWQAYASIRPLEPVRDDVIESRIVGTLCGKASSDVMIEWFDKKYDPDYIKEVDAQSRAELEEAQAKRAQNGQTD